MSQLFSARLKSNPLRWTIFCSVLTFLMGCSQQQSTSLNPSEGKTAIAATVELTDDQNIFSQRNSASSGQFFSKSNACVEQNPFDESVKFALKASNLAQTANSKEDWDEVARYWVQAVAWMQAVSPNSPQRTFAEKKVIEYMRNLAYSQQQAAQTLSAKNNFPSFDSEPFDKQLQLYLSYLSTVGKPDILIVGSSRALQGIDPIQMQQSLAQKGYRGLKVFNFGINGATAQVVDYLLRKVLTPEQLPKLIIWADGVRAFNSGRLDRTYQAILASAAHQKIAAGIRPKLAQNQQQKTQTCYQLPQLCNSGETIKFKIQNSKYSQNPVAEIALVHEQSIGSEIIDLVYQPSEQTFSTRLVSLNSIDANGFLPLSERFNPSSYYRQKPYVSGAYDGDYQAFNLSGQQSLAFDSVVAFTRSKNITLVFVSLPLTDDYLDGVRWSAEVQFRQWMQGLSQDYGFIFLDLSERSLTQYNYFADPSHLNLYGAKFVAQKIVTAASIPWPRSQQPVETKPSRPNYTAPGIIKK